LLSVELGPGLLGQIYDGLQKSAAGISQECGFFLKRGVYEAALSEQEKWQFAP